MVTQFLFSGNVVPRFKSVPFELADRGSRTNQGKIECGIQSKKKDSGDLHTIKRLKRLLKSFCVMRALAGKQQKGRTWTTPFSQLAGKQVSAALVPGSGLRPREKR